MVIVGLIARARTPGKDAMGWIPTILPAVVGSFVGGFLSQMMLGRNDDMVKGSPFERSGIIGTVIGALIVLGIYHLVRRRSALPTVGR
jgi:uncharacterized membrane protein YeaQ/YmgE (transglycosylase-associated protein family)